MLRALVIIAYICNSMYSNLPVPNSVNVKLVPLVGLPALVVRQKSLFCDKSAVYPDVDV